MKSVNLSLTQPNGNVSYITINKDENGTYTFSSTGNLIKCPDCNSLFSIHAKACHICGCPLDYVISHWFEVFYKEPVVEEKTVSEIYDYSNFQEYKELLKYNQKLHKDDQIPVSPYFKNYDKFSNETKEKRWKIISLLAHREKLVKEINSYDRKVGKNKIPSFSPSDSITKLTEILQEVENMVVKIGTLKTDINSIMVKTNISDDQLGSYAKYLYSTSIEELEKLEQYVIALARTKGFYIK